MNQCKNCGTMFEGKFCPQCGSKSDDAKYCPQCGAKLSPTDKFCPECGRALNPAETQARFETQESKAESAPQALVKLCSLLPYAASVLFALFSVLLFLMFLGSVSTAAGFGTGSVYQTMVLVGDTTANLCISAVAFAALGIVFAGCALLYRFYIPLRVKKIGRVRICSCLEGVLFAFYFVDFLLACILCGTVNNGLTAPGAATVCMLVFSLFFGLCSLGIVLVNKFLPKISPAVTSELKRKAIERRAALTAPAKPEHEELQKPQKPKYPNAECSEELQTKILKHAKTRNLFTVFAGLVCWYLAPMLVFLLFLDSYEYEYNENMWPLIALCVWGGCGALLIILGGIFGSMYYKKSYSEWRSKRAWNNRTMLWTVSLCSIPLLITSIVLIFMSISAYKFVGGYLVDMYDGDVYTRAIPCTCVFYLSCVGVLCVIAAHCIAGAITRKGKKLSLSVYGVKNPRLLPEVEVIQNAYLAQQNDYLASKEVWHEYRKRLAYFEEGVAYRK